MKTMTDTEITVLTASTPFTIVHIDAAWDGHKSEIEKQIDEIRTSFEGVAFAYVDCDSKQAYVKEIGLKNTPSVAYYRGSDLVALIIGTGQDIAENLKVLMEDGTPR